jgi:hypothetical protein
MMFTDDDFYIGYETPIPVRSRSLVVGAVFMCVATAVAVAGVLVATQRPFAAASFAFGHPSEWTGTVRMDPYPTLETETGRILIAGPGKRGADGSVHEFRGRHVRLEGSLIERGSHRMVEIDPASVTPTATSHPVSAGAEHIDRLEDLGVVTLRGEIVDGKCFLGVMNPGEGTVHRDCARACLRGGLPAMFAVAEPDGTLRLMELVGADGESVSTRVAHLAGRPVSIEGQLLRRQPSSQLVVRVAVNAIQTN